MRLRLRLHQLASVPTWKSIIDDLGRSKVGSLDHCRNYPPIAIHP